MFDNTTVRPADDTAELVNRIRRGDASAEAEFVVRFQRGLLILLKQLTRDTDLAQDLRQDVLRIALERLRSRGIDEPERLAGWLAGTARKLAFSETRKQARRRTWTGLPEDGAAIVDESEGQADVMERDEQVGIVRTLIGEMPNARDRELLFRYYVGDEDKDVLCDHFGLTPEHFHRVLYRARQRFKALYEQRAAERDLQGAEA